MTNQAEPISGQAAIKRRFIACTQSTGRIGKSTVAEGLIGWLRYAGVAFVAVDADSNIEHFHIAFRAMWNRSMPLRRSTTSRA